MALGVTKSEMGAMALLATVIAGGLAAREWSSAPAAPPAASGAGFASPPGKWETLAEVDLRPKDSPPRIKAVPRLVALSNEALGAGAPPAVAAAAPSSANPASSSAASVIPPPAAPAEDNPAVLDLNAATSAQLERLPGIGPSRAAAILAERAKLGAFASVDQLRAVHGIGEKTLQKLRSHLRVGGAPAVGAVHASAPADPKRTAPPKPIEAAIAAPPAAPPAAAPAPVAASIGAPAVAPVAAAPKEPARAAPPGSPTRPVNVNTAGPEELASIPGIGPVLARRIMERRAQGRFRRPEDLLAIKGIGPKSLQKMRAWIEL